MHIYYIIYCGSSISPHYYMTKMAAYKAAHLYTELSRHKWRVRMMIGTVSD